MTFDEAKRSLQRMFRTVFTESGEALETASELVEETFSNCSTVLDFEADELHALAMVWLSDLRLTGSDHRLLWEICQSWPRPLTAGHQCRLAR